MTNQNRSSESGRWRRAYDEEDQRSQRGREQDDDWRREDASERRFGRDEAHSRGSRSYGGTGETEPWERGGYGAGARRYGTSEREDYSEHTQNRSYGLPRGDRQDYGQDYGGQRYGGQDFGGRRLGGQRYGGEDVGSQRYGSQDPAGQRYGGQDFGGQRYGSQDSAGQRYGGQDFGGQRYGSQDSAGQRYGGQDLGGQRYGGRDYAGQRYGGQEPEGQYGGSEYRTTRYGAIGMSEVGPQGRQDQQFGGGASQNTGGWQRGEHRGKGPKGYKRSDDRIREDVCDRLSDDDELDASDITVNVKDGEVTLEGTVNDRRAKQRAEDLAESVGGVRDVDNKLRKNKGMLQEVSEKLTGSQNSERGYSGSGTKNTPPNASMSR